MENTQINDINDFKSYYFNKNMVEKVISLQENKNNQNRKPKLPKGTRDFSAF